MTKKPVGANGIRPVRQRFARSTKNLPSSSGIRTIDGISNDRAFGVGWREFDGGNFGRSIGGGGVPGEPGQCH